MSLIGLAFMWFTSKLVRRMRGYTGTLRANSQAELRRGAALGGGGPEVENAETAYVSRCTVSKQTDGTSWMAPRLQGQCGSG